MRNWRNWPPAGSTGWKPVCRRPSRPKHWPRNWRNRACKCVPSTPAASCSNRRWPRRRSRRIVALAKRAKALGTKIIVTNPSPLPNRRGKTDAQLKAQAAGLNRAGRELAALGMTLAYHNHDVELEHAAREFHHMLLATEPGCMSLCLDAHWVYRGAGHSQVALFDVLKLYGPRIVELHLRQSQGNIWSETFGDGDIDYRALWKALVAIGVKPLLVLEQGPENGTPQTMEVAEAHRRSCRYAKEVFSQG